MKVAFKISDLESDLEDISFHIFHLKTENELFTHVEELEDIRSKNDCLDYDSDEDEEYLTKQTEIELLREEHGIIELEDEYERMEEHLMDGKKYLDNLLEQEFNSIIGMLENFHF